MATTKVPERIWIETDTAYYRIVYKDRKIRDGEVEYIRADLVATPAQEDKCCTCEVVAPEGEAFRVDLDCTCSCHRTPAQGDTLNAVVRQHINDLRGCSSILKVSPYREALRLTIQEIDKSINELEAVLRAPAQGAAEAAAQEIQDDQDGNVFPLPVSHIAAIIARHCVR